MPGTDRAPQEAFARVARGLIIATLLPVLRLSAGVAPATPRPDPPGGPVILIPGFMGSKLADERGGRLVWGSFFDLTALTAHEAALDPVRDGLELPIDNPDFGKDRDHIQPVGILDRFTLVPHLARVNVYRKTLDALEHHCGYTRGHIETCELGSNLYVFDYDWRRDLVESARLLAQRIRHVQDTMHDPDRRVTLIAHSMGGLIALYYLLYGDRDVLNDASPSPDYAGLASVRRVYLIAPPLSGAVSALRYLQEGYGHLGHRIGPYAAFTIPAVYEMLPHEPAPLFLDPALRPVELNLYDPDQWRQHGLGIYSRAFRRKFLIACKRRYRDAWREKSVEIAARLDRHLAAELARARAFHAALAAADHDRLRERVEIIGGRDLPTPARIILDSDPARPELDFTGAAHPALSSAAVRRMLYSPGDETVTVSSLEAGDLFGKPMFVPGRHLKLSAQREVLDYLTTRLGGLGEHGTAVDPDEHPH